MSITWDDLPSEKIVDPYTWSADELNNISTVETFIVSIKPSTKDATIIINGNTDSRFSLEQTVLTKRNGKYFFGTTGMLEVGDLIVVNNNGNFEEKEITELKIINESRTVYQFDADPYDMLIAGDIAVHNAKAF